MENIEKKRLLEEMDRRTTLWGAMRNDAKRRMGTGNEKAIAETDLRVAEDALKRIENRKKEIRGETREVPTRLFKVAPGPGATKSVKERKEDPKNAI